MKDKFMKNGVFSLEYDKETLRDMVLELQEENTKLINQQKTFIKWLEDEIKELQKIKETELDYDILKDVIPQLLVYKEILQKYKSILGNDK